jgi:ferredoxin-NADP reductase
MPLPDRFQVRLAAARPLTPSVRELTFERADGAPVAFQPGQWVSLLLPVETVLRHWPVAAGRALKPGAEGEVRRSYSIASAPDGSGRFSIAVTRVADGPGSHTLHGLAPGAALEAIGPQGFFTRPARGGPPSLFVGTGTGLAPLRSMLAAALAAGADEPLWVLLGVRHEEDLLYRDELEAMARARPNVRVDFTLSAPGAGWRGRSGYVQAHVRGLLGELGGGGGAAPHLYICGLERMVKAVRDLARKELGLGREQVHSERFD